MRSQLSFAFRHQQLIGVLLLSLSFNFDVQAQEYPVQITTVLTPPYTPYLSDYAAPHRDALQLIILLRELDRPQYNVKLRFTIEGQGIRIRTKSTYNPRPITIQGGVPSMLGAADFNSYFHPDNLDFSGITKDKFLRTTALPDGFYTFTVEVLDYTRSVVVSNAGTANAWIMLNDPPLINFPANNEKITATDPQNIFFSWTPLHLGSPNSAFASEYIFTLVELYPIDRNPNDAMLTTNFIFTHTTSATSLNYGIAEPLLIPGRKYAFRVQARDVSGQDLFKNKGNSEVFVFQYGDACVAPTKIKIEPLDGNRIRVSWEENEVHSGYTIRYRKKGATNWFEELERSTSKVITDLEPGTKYEFQVVARCQTLYSDGTSIEIGETPMVSEDKFACGTGSAIDPPSTIPLQHPLIPGDIIRTADFTIKITEVTGNPGGTYKGKGTTTIPLFNNAMINVKFRDIMVNYQYIVYAGVVSTVYSNDSRGVIRVKEESDNKSPIPTSDAPDIFAGVDIPFDSDIDGVAIDTVGGKIVVTLADGTIENIDRPKDEKGNFVDTRITDENGDVWVVDKEGEITEIATNENIGSNSSPEYADSLHSTDSLIYKLLMQILEKTKDSSISVSLKFTQNIDLFKENVSSAGFNVVYYTGKNNELIKEGFSSYTPLFIYDDHIGFKLTQKEKDIESAYANLYYTDKTAIRLNARQLKCEQIIKDRVSFIEFAAKVKTQISDEENIYSTVYKNI